jgi:hypothetical protein
MGDRFCPRRKDKGETMRSALTLVILALTLAGSASAQSDMYCHHIPVVFSDGKEATELPLASDQYRDVCQFTNGTVVVTEVNGDSVSIEHFTLRTWHRQVDKENLEIARLNHRLKKEAK